MAQTRWGTRSGRDGRSPGRWRQSRCHPAHRQSCPRGPGWLLLSELKCKRWRIVSEDSDRESCEYR